MIPLHASRTTCSCSSKATLFSVPPMGAWPRSLCLRPVTRHQVRLYSLAATIRSTIHDPPHGNHRWTVVCVVSFGRHPTSLPSKFFVGLTCDVSIVIRTRIEHLRWCHHPIETSYFEVLNTLFVARTWAMDRVIVITLATHPLFSLGTWLSVSGSRRRQFVRVGWRAVSLWGSF